MKATLLLSAGVLLGTSAFAQDGTTVYDDASFTAGNAYTIAAGETATMNGLVYVESGATLTIEAGAVLGFRTDPDGSASGDNTSALIITKGAQIFVNGTADAPVIFTFEGDDVSTPLDIETPTSRGFWGGLIILGNGTVARPGGVDGVEGIDAEEARAAYGGGDTPDDTESSGSITYLSIRHGGRALTTDNEINGLTLAGVGSGTTIDYVEVYANDDDGIEWFGGTVDVKHAVISFCADDSYDWDQGWRGRGQYWFSINGDDISGRAGEHDGANPDGQAPFSNPVVANATYIGSGATGTNTVGGEGNDYALLMRDNTGGKYYNSVFTDFRGQFLDLEDLSADKGVDSYDRLVAGDIVFAGNVIGEFGGANADNSADLSALINLYEDGADPTGATVLAALTASNRSVGDTSLVYGISRKPESGTLDPRPSFDSPLLDGGLRVDVPAEFSREGDFFEDTEFIGAFSADADQQWLGTWTALSTYGFLSANLVSTAEPIAAQAVSLFPNPTREAATLTFDLDEAARVHIGIYNLQGQLVNAEAANLTAGAQQATLSTATLAAGTYYVRLVAGQQTVTRPLHVIRN